MSSNESNTDPGLSKAFSVQLFSKLIEQAGLGIILGVLLILFFQAETRRWDERARMDEERWNQLFRQSNERNAEALKTIEACCHDRLERLEEIEVDRRRGR